VVRSPTPQRGSRSLDQASDAIEISHEKAMAGQGRDQPGELDAGERSAVEVLAEEVRPVENEHAIE
jgi:hypothetical protein